MPLTLENFDYVDDLVRRRSAVVLGREKQYLAEGRLLPMAKKLGHDSVDAFVTCLRTLPDPVLQMKVVEAMTTNETSFFRDSHPFECLRKRILPELIQRRSAQRSLSIWSAACSTGQEPYSIAMLLCDSFPELSNWNVTILASDLGTENLERARSGRFSQMEVNRGLPAHLLVKYFQRQGLDWQLGDNIRRLVEFHRCNLAGALWPAFPPIDIIFLRNVLIYFDESTRKQILARIRRLLCPDGYLFLGGAETTLNLDDAFEPVVFEQSRCYRLREASTTVRDPIAAAATTIGA